MIMTSKIKSSIFGWLCLLVVVLVLAENRAWGIFQLPQPESGQIEPSSPEGIEENAAAWHYDASGYAVAPEEWIKEHRAVIQCT